MQTAIAKRPKDAAASTTPEIRSLDTYPEWATVRDRLSSLKNQLHQAEARCDDLRRLAQEHAQAVQARALALVNGEPLPKDDRQDLVQRMRSAQADVEVLAEAVRLAEGRLKSVTAEASRHVNESARGAHRKACSRIATALIELVNANAAEAEIRQAIELAGARCSLHPAAFVGAGDPRDTSAPIAHWARNMVDMGLLSPQHPLVEQLKAQSSEPEPDRRFSSSPRTSPDA
jgi:hypothetical protein